MKEKKYRSCLIRINRLFRILLLLLFIFSAPQSSALAKDKVNLAFSGSWRHAGPVICSEFFYSGYLSKNLLLCGTANGFLILDIDDPNNPAEVTFLEIGQVNDIALSGLDSVAGTYALLANGTKGLTLFDISNPQRPIFIGRFETYDAQGIEQSGNLAYIADGVKGLLIVDVVTEPARPRFIGGLDTLGTAYGIAVSSDVAFVADGLNGIVVIDVSDPFLPRYVQGLPIWGAQDITVSGDYAYVAARQNGVTILNITNPLPLQIFTVKTWDAWDVTILGNYAYIADAENGLTIMDISNPTSPLYIGGYDVPGFVNDLTVADGLAYITDRDNGILIIDISDLTGLSFLSQLLISNLMGVPGSALGVAMSGNHVYVACGETGLAIIDRSNSSPPVYLNTLGYAYDVALSGDYNHAYIANGKGGLAIVNISEPASAQFMGTYPITQGTPFEISSIAIAGDYVYAAAKECVLSIIDVSNPSDPRKTGSFNTSCGLGVSPLNRWGVAVSGDYVYLAAYDNGLIIIDKSNPASPQKVGQYDTKGHAMDVAISGTFAYIADGDNGLVIIDISNKAEPAYVGDFDTPGDALAITFRGNNIYIADGWNGLMAVDIKDPQHPRYLGSFDIFLFNAATPVNVSDLGVFGAVIDENTAYLAGGAKGLMKLDVSDPVGAFSVGRFGTSGISEKVIISDDYVYLADNENGLVILDATNPSQIIYIGGYDTKGNAMDLAVYEGHAYIADLKNGLVIVDLTDPAKPLLSSRVDTWNAHGVAVSGDYAYIADKENGLAIADISALTLLTSTWDHNPSFGYYDTRGITIHGDFLYSIEYGKGIWVFAIDHTNPTNLVNWSVLNILHPMDIAVSQNIGYAVDDDFGLTITRVPNILIYSNIATPGNARDITVEGNNAFIADNQNGLVVVDVSNPVYPSIAGGFKTTGEAKGVAVSGEYAYVADGPYGLIALKIINPPQPKANLILCPSGPAFSSNPLWQPSQILANKAYSIFFSQDCPDYSTYYLNPNPFQDINGDGIIEPFVVDDFDPGKGDIKYAITDWAYNRLNTGPLYLYFTGLGANDSYQIFPGEILKASDANDPGNQDTLKHYIDAFQKDTERDIIALLEFSSSGSFCDDLIDAELTPYCRTIITCTDNGVSFLDPNGELSFTGRFLKLLQESPDPDLFEDTGISFMQRVKLLQGIFSEARRDLWSSRYPFNEQPPQLVTAQGPHTLYSITISADPALSTITDPNKGRITNPDEAISLQVTGNYFDGPEIIDPGHIYFRSTDPSILLVTPDGDVYPNSVNRFNGKAYVLATIIDPDFTQSPQKDPNTPCLGGVTGRIPVSVEIPSWHEKEDLPFAIIVAGKKEKRDYLWEEIHTISAYAYLTFLSRGYSRNRIYYLSHLKEELLLDNNPHNDNATDIDADGDPNNDIDGIPCRESIMRAFEQIKTKGTNNLTIFLVDHGIEKGNATSPSGGIYLAPPTDDPNNILTPLLLDQWLDGIQDTLNKITIIIESCHSGLFIDHLQDPNRIIITSTLRDEAYICAHGLGSFSYSLFTYLQSGINLAAAFENASSSMQETGRFIGENRQSLNEHRQIPQISNISLAETTHLGGSFLISQDQPVITSVKILPDPNTISINQPFTIQAKVSDLDEIDEVKAIINAAYIPVVFTGDPDRPIVELPTIDLEQTGDDTYEATYSEITYNGSYTVIVYARDSKGTVSLPSSISFDVSGSEQTTAILIAGQDNAGSGFSALVDYGKWVLEQKGFSHVEILKEPGLTAIENTFNTIDPNALHQLFIYLVGTTEQDPNQETVFRLNENEILRQNTLDDLLVPFLGSTCVVLADASNTEEFLKGFTPPSPSSDHTFIWSASSAKPAYFEKDAYLAFSRFFFTCIYWGANVYQAYGAASDALKHYSDQTPGLNDGQGGKIAHATYLGSPFDIETKGPKISVPPDQIITTGYTILWAEVQDAPSGLKVWGLVKEPGTTSGELKEVEFLQISEKRYEAGYHFTVPGLYSVNTYVQDPNGLIDFDQTQYLQQSGEDSYEDDDGPDQANLVLIDKIAQRFHNLDNVMDEDWIIFYAYKDRTYEIHINRHWNYWGDSNCNLIAYVFDADGDPVLDENQEPLRFQYNRINYGTDLTESHLFHPKKTGYYYIRFTYGCPDITPASPTFYEIVKITYGHAHEPTGYIIGHVRSYKSSFGIPGATIIVGEPSGSLQEPYSAVSWGGGEFFLDGIESGKYHVYATAYDHLESEKINVEVYSNCLHIINLSLKSKKQDPNISASGKNPVKKQDIERLREDAENYHSTTIYTGMNLFSCPCRPEDCPNQAGIYNSTCFLQEAHKAIQDELTGHSFSALIQLFRYNPDDKQWQINYIYTSEPPQILGDSFSLSMNEGYIVYLDIDTDKHLKSVTFPFPCADIDTNETGYNLRPVFNLTGFSIPFSDYEMEYITGGYDSEILFNDPNLEDGIVSILKYLPQTGKNSHHYRFFGRSTANIFKIIENNGYGLFLRKGISNWHP